MKNLELLIDTMAAYMVGKGLESLNDDRKYVFPYNLLESIFDLPVGIFDTLIDLRKLLLEKIAEYKVVDSVFEGTHVLEVYYLYVSCYALVV